MKTNTNFETWLDAEEFDDEQDKQDLIDSVRLSGSVGLFTTTENNGQLFVRGVGDETLRIANENARDHFIRRVRRVQVPDELDIAFRRAVDNPNS